MIAKAYQTASLVLGLRFKRSPKKITDHVLSCGIIRPNQVPSELHRLAQIVASLKPNGVLEIGTFKGGTLCIFSRLASPIATITSVDLPGGEFGGGYSNKRSPLYRTFSKYLQRMTLIRADSHSEETLTKVKAVSPRVDFLFIDGDHSYSGVKRDFELYSQLVPPGGVIAFHDIAQHPPEAGCEVKKFWDEIKTRYRHEEIIENPAQGWAGIGVLYV